MTLTISAGKFPVGRIVITPGALHELSQQDVLTGLVRHVSGDWGELDEHDWRQNEAALEHGGRLFSQYVRPSGTFWIITEHDRSVTTILLPSEY